jgi:fatty acid desaturase
MAMHHVENNMPEDTSSTLPYQRDKLSHFVLYYLNFFFLGFKETFLYLFSHKKKKMYMRITYGEFSFLIFCSAMCFVNLQATLFIFIFPYIFARMVMMLGNWAQHAFVDLKAPEENTINCINTKYNHTCWNDGYHAVHHLRPALHYTDIPAEFMKNLDKFTREKTLIFEGIHYLHIFTWLMQKRYDKLADHIVNVNNMFSSREEAIAVMKERTRQFPKEALQQLQPAI